MVAYYRNGQDKSDGTVESLLKYERPKDYTQNMLQLLMNHNRIYNTLLKEY